MKFSSHLSTLFDQAILRDGLDKGSLRALGKGGALLRKIARRRLRSRSRKALPGESPTSRTGKLKRSIFYAVLRWEKAVVIGPVHAGEEQTAGALEHGGWWTIPTAQGRRRQFFRKFPFMAPALDAARPYLTDLWANALIR